jgi:UDP-GlcNAc:undecaprenyl-phosphate GlcNAc-1-phosphate transferase
MLFVGLASLIIAMGVTWMVTPLIARLAHALGAVDDPGGRKVHTEPIPRIGGLAVFIGFVAGLGFAAYATGATRSLLSTGPGQVSVYWKGMALAAAFVLLVGLLDDLRGLSFRWKFIGQIAAASFVWYCGFRIEVITHPLGGPLELGAFSFPLTLLWIVGITNAVNLIDGLDGLAPGIALITTTAVAVIAFVRGELGVTAASVALAGSLMGFLRYNVNPARIFLGDSGSMFLGFVLAVTSVRGSQKGPTAVAILVPLLVLGLPLLDTSLAIVRRVYRLGSRGAGADDPLRYVIRNVNHVFLPDRGHIHHRLLDFGLSHRRAVQVLYGVGCVFAICAFGLVVAKTAWLAFLLLGVLVLLMAALLAPLYFGKWGLLERVRWGRAPGPRQKDQPGKALAASPPPTESR